VLVAVGAEVELERRDRLLDDAPHRLAEVDMNRMGSALSASPLP